MSLEPPHPVVGLFGRRVKRYRVAVGWSMRELARKANVSASTVSRAEASEWDMNLSMAARMSAALGVSLSKMVADAICQLCDGEPPEGFTCNGCGRSEPA